MYIYVDVDKAQTKYILNKFIRLIEFWNSNRKLLAYIQFVPTYTLA